MKTSQHTSRPAQPEYGRDHVREMYRTTARLVGGLAALLWTAALIASAVLEDPTAVSIEGYVLASLILAASAGVLTAFRAQKAGGLLALSAGAALVGFALLTARSNHSYAVLAAGVPFIVSGWLFIADAGRRPGNPGAGG